MNEIYYFVDAKKNLRSNYPELVAALGNIPSICTFDEEFFEFKIVGVFFILDTPIIVFPKNTPSLKQSEAKAYAQTLLKALIRYKNEVFGSSIESSVFLGDSEMSSSRIVSAIFLLEDYCQYGLISRHNIVSSDQKLGRVNWGKTINKTYPLLSNSSPIYIKPIMKQREFDENNPIRLIHKHIINECFLKWGWYLGYDEINNEPSLLPFPFVEALELLENELSMTFNVREIQVLENLIKYITNFLGGKKEKKIEIIATANFHFIWETICGYVLNNQYGLLKDLLPQPIWESAITSKNISQRPDIFHINEDKLYIFDAKYYDYKSNLPGWSDAVKQFFYSYTLKQAMFTKEFKRMAPHISKIYNGFIFPGNGPKFQYIGRVIVPKVEELSEIKAFSMNQQMAISSYAHLHNKDFVEEIKKQVGLEYTVLEVENSTEGQNVLK